MAARVWFLLVTLFFITMNALLWRSEFGRKTVGSPVPPETVWRRMLECSDSSKLEIRRGTQRFGSLDWRPNLIEAPPEEGRSDPEGMVRRITGYRIDVDQGNLYLPDQTYLGFSLDLAMNTNYAVQFFQVSVSMRLQSDPRLKFTIRGDAATRRLTIRPPLNGEDENEQVIPFDDLENPEKLVSRLGGPFLPATLAAFGVSFSQLQASAGTSGVNWQAVKGHRVALGHAQVPVYRLYTTLLNRYLLNVYVTEGGEIFRVELPNEIILVNEKLTSL
jgi:hypothetical protein